MRAVRVIVSLSVKVDGWTFSADKPELEKTFQKRHFQTFTAALNVSVE